MTSRQALAFVRRHGVVLEAAAGPVPCLAEAIAGGAVRGSWWSHSRGHEIFALTRAVRDSDTVLVCRLVGGKVSYVHRRLWPALVRAADRFPRERLARIHERHLASGRHALEEVVFPKWVPPEVRLEAERLAEDDAVSLLGSWCA